MALRSAVVVRDLLDDLRSRESFEEGESSSVSSSITYSSVVDLAK